MSLSNVSFSSPEDGSNGLILAIKQQTKEAVPFLKGVKIISTSYTHNPGWPNLLDSCLLAREKNKHSVHALSDFLIFQIICEYS